MSVARIKTSEGWADLQRSGLRGDTGPQGVKGDKGDKGDIGYDTAPIGTILTWTGKTTPEGYVLADGTATYTQTQYPQGYDFALAEKTAGNTLWDANTTAKTFKVPDLRDRFIYGAGAKPFGKLSTAVEGEETHTLTTAEIPGHTHTASSNEVSTTHVHALAPGSGISFLLDAGSGGSSGTGTARQGTTSNLPYRANNAATAYNPSGDSGGRHSHTITVDQNTGGGGVHNNMPPYAVLAYIVKLAGVTASASVIQGPPGLKGDDSTVPGPAGPQGSPGLSDGPAGGDLSGNYPDPTVVKASGPSMTIAGRLLIPGVTGVSDILLGGDTQLWRDAGALRTNAQFKVGQNLEVGKDTAGGTIYFGSAADTNLYRALADTLRTDDNLLIAGALTVGAGSGTEVYAGGGVLKFGGVNGDTSLYRSAAGIVRTDELRAIHLSTIADGEVEPSLKITGSVINFGAGGSNPTDTNLYRIAANKLKTGGDFEVVGKFIGKGAVPLGGTIGQVLAKKTATDFDTEWIAPPAGGSGGGGGHTIQDEGVSLAARAKLNFRGTGVTVADDAANDRTVVDVPAITAAAAWAPVGGTTIDIAGSWKAMPLPALTMEPAGAFTVVSNTVTVTDAGWYDIAATMMSGQGATANSFLSLSTKATGGDGDIANGSGSTLYTRCTASGSVKLAAGAKVYVYGWSNGASPVNCSIVTFSIARVGGPKGDKGDTGGNATVPMDPWHTVGAAGEPAFIPANGWSHYDVAQRPAQFRKDPLGRVWLRGYIKSGTTGVAAFTLPAGYFPSHITHEFAVCANGSAGTAYVASDGRVVPLTGNNAYFDLDGMSFDTGTVTQMPTGPQGPKGDTGDPSTSGPFVNCSAGTVTAVAAGNATLPIGSIVQISNAADFTRNANGSVTINKAGNYVIAAGCNCNTQLPANTRTQFELRANGGVFMYQSGHDPWAQASLTAIRQCAAGDVITVNVWNDLAVQEAVNSFSIAATTGPKGDDTGVYVGTAEPSGAQTIWLDTDETSFMQAVPFVSVLPASPLDGQEVYFQTATMATEGVVWHLRYRAASASIYKWEFVGGADLAAGPAGSLTFGTAAVNTPLTNGPTIVLPLTGHYRVWQECMIQSMADGLFSGNVLWAINGVTAGVVAISFIGRNIYDGGNVAGYRLIGAAAGNTLSVLCNNNNAVSTQFQQATITVRPVRVG